MFGVEADDPPLGRPAERVEDPREPLRDDRHDLGPLLADRLEGDALGGGEGEVGAQHVGILPPLVPHCLEDAPDVGSYPGGAEASRWTALMMPWAARANSPALISSGRSSALW